MIQQETMLEIADNSGVKVAQCIKVLGKCSSGKGKYTRPTATVGDDSVWQSRSICSNCQLDKKKVHKCVIIRTKSPVRRPDGSHVRSRQQCGGSLSMLKIIPSGHVFWARWHELREKNFMKIISLAGEVV